MEDPRTRGRHDLNLASRRAEEAALRRYQATHWLECLVGPLGILSQPSEREFISCLRNGLVLCNLINKIQPGSVPKVVENQSHANSLNWDSQPLPAYQYFENVRNFLVAIEGLKLPVFEASVFERDNIEEGSSAKVVDCILALKAYHEWKQLTGNNRSYKAPRSPFLVHSSGRIGNQTPGIITSNSCRKLDMSTSCHKQALAESDNQKFQELIIKALAEQMVETKENKENNIIASFCSGNTDAVMLFERIVSTCLEKHLQKKFPKFKSESLNSYGGRSSSPRLAISIPLKNLLPPGNCKCCRACLSKDYCKHWTLVEMQEKELLNLKALLSTTRKEFEDLQTQLSCDFKQLGGQVQEMSFAALKYHKVVEENRNLYNMVQDLKGNIRVYCRIRPVSSAEAKSVTDFIGEDGSLVVLDPLKLQKDGRKVFHFNHVFGPTASQDEVYRETQPLVRSVMDGYNVCIFAYGQTGSGKSHTMCGPSGGSTAELGINYLALNDLFQLSDRRKDIMKYDMHVQMVEIYNEQVRDLLAEDSSVTKLEIRSCCRDNDFALPDALMHRVMSATDIINLMKIGEMNRAVGSTAINAQSSRSHSVLSIHVRGEDPSGSTLCSSLHLVDLAGSERVDKSGVTGEGLKEAQYINKSLSCLGDVITALAEKNSYVPYRNSKLTLLLQNALGGHAKTLMFAHVSPEGDSFGETISTLKFAQRVSTVELGAACVKKESSEVFELKAQIERLQIELANKEPNTPQRNKPKELVLRTPYQKPKPMTEKTPLRSRRLSIENCSTRKVDKMNFNDKKGPKTPSVQPRLRRLSLEGPRHANKDPEQIKFSDPVITPVCQEATYLKKPSQHQDAESLKKPNGGGSTVELDQPRPPRSPRSSAFKVREEKTDNRRKVLDQPKTPEPAVTSSNEGQKGIKSEHRLPSEFFTPGLTNSSAQGKRSQIRKSLHSLGKLINGSEKRNQKKLTEILPVTPTQSSSSKHDAKSPIPSNARVLRRQSLTGGVHPHQTIVEGADENRNSKTPPPIRASTQPTKRWL